MPLRMCGRHVSRLSWLNFQKTDSMFADDDAKPMASKYLAKWRPGFMEANKEAKEVEDNKFGAVDASQNGISVR